MAIGTCATWIVAGDVDGMLSAEVADKVDLDAVVIAASDILRALSDPTGTGARFCVQTHVARPHRVGGECACGLSAELVSEWWARGGCPCGPTQAGIVLGRVASVEAVTIDGADLDPAAYRLYEGRLLVRVDGDGWPCCQLLSDEPGSAGTWSITYTTGTPVPQGGKLACLELATELAKAMGGDESCQLPRSIQSLTRQNLTLSFNPREAFDNGRVGLPIADMWLESVNPAKPRQRGASIGYPGMPGLAITSD